MNSTLRWITFGHGKSRQSQNRGAVGQVTRAMVVDSPSLLIVIVFCSMAESGASQVRQSPSPVSNAQRCGGGASCTFCTEATMRSLNWGSTGLPRVATEIVRRARLIVTASRDGSRARASATERARQSVALAWSGLVSGSRETSAGSRLEAAGFVGVDDKRLVCSDRNFYRFAAGRQEIQRPRARALSR